MLSSGGLRGIGPGNPAHPSFACRARIRPPVSLLAAIEKEPLVRSTALVPAALFLATAACAADKDITASGNASSLSSGVPAPTRPAPKTRHFELHYEATVKSAPAGSNEVDVWLP